MPRKKKEQPVLDPEIYTKTGKLRKRKPKQSRNYFTQETEDAIIQFVKTTDQRERDRLFNEHINYSLHKLAENIIHNYKFYYTEVDNVEDLKHEVVYDLLQRFHLYDQSKGKAFSYFGTIAKRYLIRYNQSNYKKRVDRKELDSVDEDKSIVLQQKQEQESSDICHFIDSYIKYIEKNIDRHFHKEKEKEVINAVIILFKKREELADLEILNKQVIYLQLREMTDQNTQFITKVLKQFREIMKQQMKIYYLNGGLEIEEDNIYR